MSEMETRSVSRDSLFLLASVKREGEDEIHRVRVRNLSNGGMMGEGNLFVQRGARIEVELRNIGRVKGSVAWVQDYRFGIAFDHEIDAQRARKPAEGKADDTIMRSWAHRAPSPVHPRTLRKV